MDNKQILSEIIVQISGFLIVFWILKKFAWSKLLGIMDARRKKIENEFLTIELKKKEIESIRADYENRLKHIEEDARAIIQEASNRGYALSKEIEAKARAEADKVIECGREEVEQMLTKAKAQMRDEIVDVSAALAEKVIAKKLDSAEHERLIRDYMNELEKLS